MITSLLHFGARLVMAPLLALLVLGLSGCSRGKTELQIGTNLWVGYEPLYLARSLGFFGKGVRLVEFTSTTDTIRAFRSGAIDGAAVTLDEALLLAQDQNDIRVVLVFDVSVGADAVLAQPGIKNLADLKGRKVGVENSALGAFMLTRALQSGGMSRKDIELVPLDPSAQENTFKSKKIDAVVAFEPNNSKLKAAGASTLFDSSQIPNEIVDLLVIRSSVLDKDPAIARKLRQAWFKALRYFTEYPLDAGKRMMPRLGAATPEEVLLMFKGLHLPTFEENRRLLAGGPDSLAVTGKRMAEVMLAEHLLAKPVEISTLLAPIREEAPY
ncbi:MAG: ABC transporter substrate-binding protein [Thermodesulfobacteriota bacterium]